MIALTWLGIVLGTQAWPAWSRGIVEQFATDIQSYERIARAAPGLPDVPLPRQHAERFPIHWLIGTLADVTGADLVVTYRVVTLTLLLVVVAVLVLTLRGLRADAATHAVVIGLLVASAYPFRYLLAAPGMTADALFLLGLALAVLAFERDDIELLVAGLVLATLGRQTAVPVALAAAALLAIARRFRAAVLVALTPVLVYAVLRIVASSFAAGGALAGASSVVSALGDPHTLADHLGRMGLALALPLALIAGTWLRTGVPPGTAPVVLAAAVIVQPLVLSPDWVIRNEPRLTGLALPALAVAAVAPLIAARLTALETGVVCMALLLGSFHARYSDVGVAHAWQWAGLVVVGSAVTFGVLVRPRLATVLTRPALDR